MKMAVTFNVYADSAPQLRLRAAGQLTKLFGPKVQLDDFRLTASLRTETFEGVPTTWQATVFGEGEI
jgi:hypothetical protein